MTLIKWEPFNEIERFFGDHSFPSLLAFRKLGWDLAIDVYEEKDTVMAKMSLPGIKPEDIEISLEGEILTISGRREEEKETDKKDYYSKEIRRGSFSRSVRLPQSVDAKKTEAKYEDGVLIVTMPVIAGTKEKVVKVAIKQNK